MMTNKNHDKYLVYLYYLQNSNDLEKEEEEKKIRNTYLTCEMFMNLDMQMSQLSSANNVAP